MWEFTLAFLVNLLDNLADAAPLFAGLIVIIGVLSVLVGRQEDWSLTDSLYYGFVTATTVGYGDFHPTKVLGKWLAILIAMFGLILTGIVVAVAVEAAKETYIQLAEAGVAAPDVDKELKAP